MKFLSLILSFFLLTSCSKKESFVNLNKSPITDTGTPVANEPPAEQPSPEIFITTWRISADNLTLNLPLQTGFNYNFEVDWGDGTSGTVTSWNDSYASHTYTSPGTYEVKMKGVYEYFGNLGCPAPEFQLINIKQWGSNKWKSMKDSFCSEINLEISAPDAPDLSEVTDTSGMFKMAAKMNSPLYHWDVSQVTDMNNMFNSAFSFNQSLNDWDVSQVTNMSDMFASALAFNQPLNNWKDKVSQVTNMNLMFGSAFAFNQDLSCWTVNGGVNSTNFNSDTNHLTPPPFGGTGAASCLVLQETPIGNMTPGSLVTTWKITPDNLSLTLPITGGTVTVDWGDGSTSNSIPPAGAAHLYATPGFYHVTVTGPLTRFGYGGCINAPGRNRLVDIKQWGSSQWTDFVGAFCFATNLNISATDAPDLSLVTDLSAMFGYATNFNSSINHWDVSSVENMSTMFSLAASFNRPLSNWDVSNVTNMRGMFSSALSFNQPLNNWQNKVSQVTDMSDMFNQAFSFNQNLSCWNVTGIVSAPSNFNTYSPLNPPTWGTDGSSGTCSQ